MTLATLTGFTSELHGHYTAPLNVIVNIGSREQFSRLIRLDPAGIFFFEPERK